MKIKEYKLYKTAKKTAKENGLEYVDSFETGKREISCLISHCQITQMN